MPSLFEGLVYLQIVHLIRHGHTTYTEGYFRSKPGNHPFDVIISPTGIQQVAAPCDF